MSTVTLEEAQAHLAELIDQLQPGEQIVITRDQKPVATVCAMPPPLLIQFCAAIQPYDVMWIEEPAVPGNIEVFKRLKQQIRIPIATGERDRTIWEVMPYLQENCIDILQSDVGGT